MEQLELFSDEDFQPEAVEASEESEESGDEDDDEDKPELPLADILEAARRGAKIILL